MPVDALVFRGRNGDDHLPTPAETSLLSECESCRGACCVGRTLTAAHERERIVAAGARDGFIHWKADLYYLERGPCPYLADGLCSVHDLKPFVCQIFPFVPRVVDGEFWLYCVGECPAAPKLPLGFVEKAQKLARAFFANRDPQDYSDYWSANKIGDFDDRRVVLRVRVF